MQFSSARSNRRDTVDDLFSLMESQWSEVYYPAGSSDRRFVVRFTGAPTRLQFQQLVKGHLKVRISVALAEGSKTALKGSIVDWLKSRNIVIKYPAQLSKVQLQILSQPGPLAGYMCLNPISNDLLAGWILPNGTCSAGYYFPESPKLKNVYPVIEPESDYLTWGKQSWPFAPKKHKFQYESPDDL